MKKTSKYGLMALLSALLLSGCHDNFNVDQLNYASKLVVYSMPAAGDTTLIRVTSSLPVGSKKASPPVTDASSTTASTANGRRWRTWATATTASWPGRRAATRWK